MGGDARLAHLVAQQGVVADGGVFGAFEEELRAALSSFAASRRWRRAVILEGVVTVHDQYQMAVGAGQGDTVLIEQLVEVSDHQRGMGLRGQRCSVHS